MNNVYPLHGLSINVAPKVVVFFANYFSLATLLFIKIKIIGLRSILGYETNRQVVRVIICPIVTVNSIRDMRIYQNTIILDDD